MAFVFGKAQRTQHKSIQQDQPGPASYSPQNQQINMHHAPFNSSTYKQSVFDTPIIKTGPGSYNPPYHKDLNLSQKPTQNSCFHSKVPRFKTETAPPPKQEKLRVRLVSDNQQREREKQAYQQAVSRTKSRMNSVQEHNHHRKIDYVGNNKEFVRIVLANPQNTEMRQSIFLDSSIRKRGSGPGSYSTHQKVQPKSVVDWSRSTHQRFNSASSLTPGPGQYQSEQQRRQSQPSAAFAYQGLRSHMDQLLYKTNVPLKVKIIEERKLKDRYPGPGQYNPQLTHSKSFHYGEDCFGSYQDEQFIEETKKKAVKQPGPGYYFRHTYGSNKDEIKKQRQKIFGKEKGQRTKEETLESQHWEEMRKQCVRDMENNKNKFYSLEERCTSKVGNFSHAQRFHNSQKLAEPGPGHYPHSPRAQSQPKAANAFNSTAQRLSNSKSMQKQEQPSQFYDVQRNDLGKRALRMKKNLQNLKQIDIEKAPFNSKQPRFGISSKKASLQTRNTPLLGSGKMERERGRGVVIKKDRVQQSSVFRSQSQQRWEVGSGDGVGPGEYDCAGRLQKKSFNVQYKYEWASRVRPYKRTKSSLE